MAPTLPVFVVGAGPSGLVATLTLLQNNIPVRIVTKEHDYRLGQRGSGIWPRTFEVFHFLRAFETHQNATTLLPVREYKPGTLEPRKTFAMTPHNDPTPSIPYNNVMRLGQPALEGILRSHLAKYGCFVELGMELRSFEDNGERVLAKFVKTKDGEEISETLEASYLIGADGAKGITRKQLGLTFLGETRQELGCVVGDLCLEIKGIDRKHWHFFGDRSSDFFMLRPTDEIAPDGFQLQMVVKNYEPKQLITDEKLLVLCMSEMIGHRVSIRKAITLSEFRMVDKFGSGRIFVVGDAAHVHSPTGAQGLNSSVQDSFNLAWKLSLVYKGLSPLTLLETYTTERLPVIAEMLDITAGILDQLCSTSRIETAMTREQKLNMLGVNYRSSPIVLDEFTQAGPVNAYRVLQEGVLVAGDRAPDAPQLALILAWDAGGPKTETRLFDVFCPLYHTVLVFAPDAALLADIEALRGYPADVVQLVLVLPQGSEAMPAVPSDVAIDCGGHAYRSYLAEKGEKKVVVVRPDGVVGAIVHGAEGIRAYFSQIFV